MSQGSGEAGGPPAQRVFICYRREETGAHAGRIYDAMVTRFGERNVFMDVDLAPGVDFVERITEVVSSCLVLIVVMGPNWATAEDGDGTVRIEDPADFVRLEVETALRRSDVTPIPVLVGGGRMPRREDLPAELQPLTRRNALEMSDSRWNYDVGRLMSTLDELLADITKPRPTVTPPPPPPEPPAPEPGLSSGRLLLEGVLVAGATAYLARRLGAQIDTATDDASEIAGVILRRGWTWALTGVALAVWLAIRTKRTDLFRLGITGLLIGAIAGAIGGAIWAPPHFLADLSVEKSNWVDVGALAVTGGILGALIGSIWHPPQRGAGIAGGLMGGVLFQLIVIATGWESSPEPSTSHLALVFGLQAVAITGIALATLLALGPTRSERASSSS